MCPTGSSSTSTTPPSIDRSTAGRGSSSGDASRRPTSCTCITSRRCTRRFMRCGPTFRSITHLHGTELKMSGGCGGTTAAPSRTASGSSGCNDGPASPIGWSSSPPTTSSLVQELLPVDPSRVTSDRRRRRHRRLRAACAHRMPNGLRCGSAGSSTNRVAGALANRRDRFATTSTTCRRSPTPTAARYRWCCSPVASCGSSGCSC